MLDTPKRIMIKVAYDGTDYHGWQKQDGHRTIEGELNSVLSEIFKEPIEVIGASRTDAGVHALGNVAVFDTHVDIPAEKVPYAMNQKLPEDIKVVEGKDVPENFHPRHCDTLKTYHYKIVNTPFEDPVRRRYAHWTFEALDAEKMQAAAAPLVGEHDFTTFCSVNAQVDSKVRTITDITVTRNDDEIIIAVTGTGFLYNMVRIIAGTLMEAGKGKITAADVKDMLEKQDRTAGGPTAPAKGLTLHKYQFLSLGDGVSGSF
mgnify:CR=1 FL=1